jgi:PST family polysaccharide transporter
LIAQSWPQLFSGIAIVVYARIDQVMLAQMLGDHEVGLYSAAVRLTEVWNFIPAIIVSSAMPLLTEYRNRSKELYYQRLQHVYTLMATVAYTVAIPTTFLAGPLVRAVYGEPYSAAASVLAVHIWSGMFVFLGMATTIWTFNEGTMRIAFFQSILGASCNILLNLYLIPLYGPLGCAIATTISYGFCAWALNLCHPKTRTVFQMQTRSLLTGLPLCAALPCFSRQHRMSIRT